MDNYWFYRIFGGRHPRNEDPDFFTDEHDLHKKDEDINVSVSFIDPFENDDPTDSLFQHIDRMFMPLFTSFGHVKFEEHTPSASNPRSLMLKDPECKECEDNSDSISSDLLKPRNFIDFIGNNGNIIFEEHTQNGSNPRSLMLKDPESKGCDVCSESKSSGLLKPRSFIDFVGNENDKESVNDGLVLENKSSGKFLPQKFSYKQFSSVKTVYLPDGTFEEHRKMTDSEGKVTNTVRRSIGEQTYEFTTRSDKQGIKEKEENLINLDESQKTDFEKRWIDLKNRKMQIQEPRIDFFAPTSDVVLPKTIPAGDPSYSSLFKKFFGF